MSDAIVTTKRFERANARARTCRAHTRPGSTRPAHPSRTTAIADRTRRDAGRHTGRHASFGLTAALCLLALLAAATSPPAAWAERRNYVLSETVGKRLLRVAELAEEEKYAETLPILEPLTQKTRLQKYDEAQIFNTYGLMLAALERYPEATKALERALAVDYLPEASMQSLRLTLAQLYLADERFDKAIPLLKQWMANQEEPSAQGNFLLAAAYAQTEQWKLALPHAREAVALSGEPVEQRLRILLAVEFELDHMAETRAVLKQLATTFPKKTYFMQLAASYSAEGDESTALAVLELADRQGFLDHEREVLQLVQRYMFADLPWPAARTLQRGLDSGVVEPTSKNLETLANALLTAREYDAALEPLTKAAELSPDGNLYVRLAQVYLEVENWHAARLALDKAVAKGDLRNPGTANLLRGISHFNDNRLDSAREAFNSALQDEQTAESARRWLEHLDRTESKRAQL